MTTSRSCSAVSSLKKRTQTQRNAWSVKTGPAQGTFTGAQPLKWCRMIFSSLTPSCNSSKSSSTILVAGCCLCYANAWRTWPFYVDSRLGTNSKSATHSPQQFNDSNYPRTFRVAIFGKPLITRFQWHIAYFTALTLGHFAPSGLVQ